jgi:hypothetical protein
VDSSERNDQRLLCQRTSAFNKIGTTLSYKTTTQSSAHSLDMTVDSELRWSSALSSTEDENHPGLSIPVPSWLTSMRYGVRSTGGGKRSAANPADGAC